MDRGNMIVFIYSAINAPCSDEPRPRNIQGYFSLDPVKFKQVQKTRWVLTLLKPAFSLHPATDNSPSLNIGAKDER